MTDDRKIGGNSAYWEKEFKKQQDEAIRQIITAVKNEPIREKRKQILIQHLTSAVMRGLIPKMGMTFEDDELQQLNDFAHAVIHVTINNLEHMDLLNKHAY